ncbi:MAG: glycosyltransferase [Ginsengibacter sp.]
MNNRKKINNPGLKPRVLIAPLEWGLGHATRCIPLITELLINKCEVFIAAESATYYLLKNEFPTINFLLLKGYHVKLSKSKAFLFWKIVGQFPKVIYAIYQENQWLRKRIKQYKFDAVISDNRFGLYNKKLQCIYITHQLLIKTGNIFTEKIVQRIHYYFINKYHECWVPDFEKDNLTGKLSHPPVVPKNVKYIGAFSRFDRKEEAKMTYDLLILLSGPEPQRTIFENILLSNLVTYNGKVLLIRGLPGTDKVIQRGNAPFEIINHLSGEDLSKTIQQSEIVISRSGYTTIMDLIKLNKKAILVPTPGQTEQEYLARYLMEKKIFFFVDQKNFNLNETLKKFSKLSFSFPVFNMEKYKSVIQEFVQVIK